MQTLILQSTNTVDLMLLKELAERLNISYFFADLPTDYAIKEEITLTEGTNSDDIIPEMGISAGEALELFNQALSEPTLSFEEFKQAMQQWRKEQ